MRRRRRYRPVEVADGMAAWRRRRRRRRGCGLLSWRTRRRRRAGVVGVVVVVRVGCGVRRSPGAVRGAAQTEVGALGEVEDLACFEAPVHHLVAVHVVAEEVRKVDEVVAVLVELRRGGGAQAPVGASAAGLRHRGHEDRVSVACVNHPDGLVLHEVDVGGREADLFAHFSERGCVRRLADLSAPAEVLPEVAGTAQQGAVPADDEDAGAREGAAGADAIGESGVRGLLSRQARGGGVARMAVESSVVALSVRVPLRSSK